MAVAVKQSPASMASLRRLLGQLSPEGRRSFVPALEWLLAFERNYRAADAQRYAAPAPVDQIAVSPAASEEAAKTRAEIVAQVWEPDLRSDLVDRIVLARVNGWIDQPTIKAAIKKALDARAEYERSGGQRGRDAAWKSLAVWIKGVYESNNAAWTPTRSAIEPRPSATLDAPEPQRFVKLPGGEVAKFEELLS